MLRSRLDDDMLRRQSRLSVAGRYAAGEDREAVLPGKAINNKM